MKIYVNFECPGTIEEFLLKFWERSYGASNLAVATYRNKACTTVQCDEWKNRSIQDIFSCVNTYFPDTSLETLLTILRKLRPGGKYFYPSYCPDIKRPTVLFYASKWNATTPLYTNGGKWAWSKIFSPLNIKTGKDLYKE